ncbi:YjbH domain-containing protein [Yoonia sp. F2084L]|uniref:YjbH domain-containing protein n=1 Tax=Yoonia sp. F2084L TaxID=2926419 RepID=UPI0032B2E521
MAEGLGGLSQAVDTPRSASRSPEDLAITLDYREDYRALSFGFQPNTRLEIGISFPTYSEGSNSSSGNELSFGLKLLDEATYLPSLTVGIVGFGSDDRGAGEYVAFGKTFGSVSATAGLGWGRYAEVFSTGRGDDEGVIETDHLFAGDTEPFANLVWDTGIDGLTAAVEYSGIAGEKDDDTYALGLSYEVSDGLFVSALGNNQDSYGIRLTFAANPTRPYVQTDIGRGPHPFVENRTARPNEPGPQQVLQVAQERLEKEGISIRRFAMGADTIDVTPSSATDLNFARVTGRVARVLSAVAPARISTFRITQNTGAFDSNVIVLNRTGLGKAVSQPNAGALAWDSTSFEVSPLQRQAALVEVPFEPRLTYGITPSFRADFVTSDNLELTGTAVANARYTFSAQTFVSGAVGYRFLNQWSQEDPPETPEIRSDLTSYTPDEIYLQSLSVRHRFRVSPEIYGRVSAGLFERAFGGVSGELLWRSPVQDFALGLEVSNVQKRAYEEWFGFEDLNATTIIGSVYANVGRNGDFIIVDTGQYLAGDLGVDLTVGRNYANGWRIAASTGWSERSDSALKFGAELSIPLGWTSPEGGKQRIDLSVGGPSGDLGSRVNGTGLLYNELRQSDRKRIEDAWGQFWN